MTVSAQRARWWCWWLSNYPCWDCISRRCSQHVDASKSAPDDHFTAGPDCRVNVSGSGRVSGAGGCPTVRAGIVSPAGVQKSRCCRTRPRRSFHCRSRLPCEGFVQRARWWCWWLSNCPCWDYICRQCSKAGIHLSTPNDHFTAGPDCRVHVSASRRIGGAGGCPTIGAGIVSPAGIQRACRPRSTPDDHFTAGPDCRVKVRPEGALAVLVAVHVSSVHDIPASAISGRV